jgi:hypothetical protein
VPDVNDRPVFSAPGDEQLRYAPFRVWIISRTIDGVIGRIDGLLHVNDEQSGSAEFRHDNPRKENWSAVYRLKAPVRRPPASLGNGRD